MPAQTCEPRRPTWLARQMALGLALLLAAFLASAQRPTVTQMIQAWVPAPPAEGASVPSVVAPAPGLWLAIKFQPGSAQMRPESGPLLADLVAAMLAPELHGLRFVIEGHADSDAPSARNQALAQSRADELRLFLIALGVPAARLRAVASAVPAPVNAEKTPVRVLALR